MSATFLGFLYKVYASAEEGYMLYPVSIAEVNSPTRSLAQSITEGTLEKAKDLKFGIPPEHVYG